MALKAHRRKTRKGARGRRAGTRHRRLQRGGQGEQSIPLPSRAEVESQYKITGGADQDRNAILDELAKLIQERRGNMQGNTKSFEELVRQATEKGVIIEDFGAQRMPGTDPTTVDVKTGIPTPPVAGVFYPIPSNISRNHSTRTWSIYTDKNNNNRYYTDIVFRIGRRHYYFRVYSDKSEPTSKDEVVKVLEEAIAQFVQKRNELTIESDIDKDFSILNEAILSNQRLISTIFKRSSLYELKETGIDSISEKEKTKLAEYEKIIKEYDDILQKYFTDTKKTVK